MFDPEILAMICGLGCALVWGSADFTAGFATKKSPVFSVLVLSQLVGLVMLFVLALLLNEPFPGLRDLLLGSLGGIAGGSGCIMLYRALAHGRMGVAAPFSALSTAVLPAVVSIFTDGMPAAHRFAGIGLALVAVWFLSGGGLRISGGKGRGLPPELPLSLAAGLGFAFFFVCIDQTSSVSIFWPLLCARCASVVLFTCIAKVRGELRIPDKRQCGLIALAGILDTGGNIFFALAAVLGRLDVAAVLSSLYPGATIVWAFFLLGERLRRTQWLGVGAALAALLLIAW